MSNYHILREAKESNVRYTKFAAMFPVEELFHIICINLIRGITG